MQADSHKTQRTPSFRTLPLVHRRGRGREDSSCTQPFGKAVIEEILFRVSKEIRFRAGGKSGSERMGNLLPHSPITTRRVLEVVATCSMP
ncbi:phospholipid N-methyltransferase [Schaalia cardiffensis F0333]|uniref:Phospholipid N-methyltransferase n=1 Tax=Schaalia cardiffensis F0333 TaxID=888050 RepID=N6X6W8_9ACTO|nr:phospholipid N-methyltransferase [Schaalia cardiffensis F0333]